MPDATQPTLQDLIRARMDQQKLAGPMIPDTVGTFPSPIATPPPPEYDAAESAAIARPPIRGGEPPQPRLAQRVIGGLEGQPGGGTGGAIGRLGRAGLV